MSSTIFFFHLANTLVLVGLIWTVQLVQYPLFARVGEEAFAAYHRGHSQRIGWLVVPLMTVELLGAVWLAADPPAAVEAGAAELALALLVVIWVSTALLQVPCHRRLAHGFDRRVHLRLVQSNWLRTVAWTARGALLLWLAARAR